MLPAKLVVGISIRYYILMSQNILYRKVAVSCLKMSKTSSVCFVSQVCTLVTIILSGLAGYFHDATALSHDLGSIWPRNSL